MPTWVCNGCGKDKPFKILPCPRCSPDPAPTVTHKPDCICVACEDARNDTVMVPRAAWERVKAESEAWNEMCKKWAESGCEQSVLWDEFQNQFTRLNEPKAAESKESSDERPH